jgi:hypothetical protein
MPVVLVDPPALGVGKAAQPFDLERLDAGV